MPTYELPLLIRVLNKPEIATVLRRSAEAIFSQGGIIRKIDNLGVNNLPYKVRLDGKSYWQAAQIIIHADLPPNNINNLTDEYSRDLDILKYAVYKQDEPVEQECTLHIERLPPVYRPDVQKLLEIAKIRANKKAKKKYKTGVAINPFQR